MERANADVSIVSAFFERQELLNDQCDIRLVLKFLDDFVGVERHAPNVEIFGGKGSALHAFDASLWAMQEELKSL